MATGVRENNGKCLVRWSYKGRRYSHQTEFAYTEAGIRKAANLRKRLIQEQQDGVAVTTIPTFGELAQTRLDTAGLTRASRMTARSVLNNYWHPFYDWPIDQVQYVHILPLVNTDRAPKTVQHILAVGSGVFQLAIKSGYRADDPTKLIKIKVPRKAIEPFTAEERDRILAHLSGGIRLFYAIRFYCGLRPGEVIALRWSDYRDGCFTVSKSRTGGVEGHTKTKRDRVIPVHPKVRAMLRDTPRSLEGHIIINRQGKPYQQSSALSNAFTAALAKLEIPYRSPYNCRHTCATMMLEAGMKPGYCAKVLGHTMKTFFDDYADWIDKDESARQAKLWESI